MPETEIADTNMYDMRVVQHEDGWIYGLFCTERRDPNAAPADQSSAVAQCGIARTKDLEAVAAAGRPENAFAPATGM